MSKPVELYCEHHDEKREVGCYQCWELLHEEISIAKRQRDELLKACHFLMPNTLPIGSKRHEEIRQMLAAIAQTEGVTKK